MESREKVHGSTSDGAGVGGVGKGSQGILRVDASKSHRIAVQVSKITFFDLLACNILHTRKCLPPTDRSVFYLEE